MSTHDLFLGHANNEPLTIDRDDLTTHALVVGRTGSGKTGLVHVLIEEAVLQGASAVVLDPKGDLTNLMLAFPGMTPAEFAPWVPAGKDPREEAARWSEGLKNTGQTPLRVAEWRNAATFRVFTPGYARNGQGVNLLPSFDPPQCSEASMRESAAHIVTSILGAIGVEADPLTDPRSVYLTDLLLLSWRKGEALPLEGWPEKIVSPPAELETLDGIAINDLFPKRDRLKLASAIVGFRRQASRWLDGPSLNMDSFLLPGPDGRPRVTIFTLRHLDQEDRMLFTSMFLSSLVDWMFKAPASGRLRALCVLDEAAGYLPPHPLNPPTKRPICTLLAQGRAQGLGMLIGTQNPNDLDYKALSNVGTWFLGGLRDRDLKRDLDNELRERGVEAASLLKLPERTFMALTKDGQALPLKVRWTLSYLRGPIDISELDRLVAPTSVIEHQPAEAPRYKVGAPAKKGRILYGYVELSYDLTDAGSLPQDMDIKYSTDNGVTWHECTPAPESEPTIGLASSPAGVPHKFLWDSVTDLGLNYVPNVMTWVRAVGRNGVILPGADVCNNCLEEESPSEEHYLDIPDFS